MPNIETGCCGFREEDFFLANDPRGGAICDPRGMVGKIYKEDYYTTPGEQGIYGRR